MQPKNLTPNPFPSGKGNRIVGSNLFTSGKRNRMRSAANAPGDLTVELQ